MKKTEITLLPILGLCNRLRVIASAISYARKNESAKIKIFWERDHGCCAEFSDLFEPIANFQIKTVDKIYLRQSRRRNFHLPSLFRLLVFNTQYSRGGDTLDIGEIAEGDSGSVFIQTFEVFANLAVKADLGRIFRPIPKLQQRINEITNNFNGEVVGLHIRRTDNVKSIESSSDAKFFSAIDSELLRNPSCKFYLATDSVEVKRVFREKYGNKIITLDFDLSRGTIQGMEDAVVDLYTLASTTKIFGSYWSSYSETASWLYNIPLCVIK